MEQNRFKEFSYEELNRINIGLTLAAWSVREWKDSEFKEKELESIESMRVEVLSQIDCIMEEDLSDLDVDDFELNLINEELTELNKKYDI